MVIGENVGVAGSASVGVGVGPEGGNPTSGISIEASTLQIGTETLIMGGTAESNLGGEKINIGGKSEINITSGTVKIN
jgi:hypothetical protein